MKLLKSFRQPHTLGCGLLLMAGLVLLALGVGGGTPLAFIGCAAMMGLMMWMMGGHGAH
jgi:hypothetical protein